MKVFSLFIGCALFFIWLLVFNRFSLVQASLPESEVYKQVEYCLPPRKKVVKIEYMASLKNGNSTFNSFYITEKMPLYFTDNIEEITRRSVIQVDDIGCLVVMPVEKFEDSMTLYMPETIAVGLLQKEIERQINQAGGLANYIKKIDEEDTIQSMDGIGDSGLYMLPETVAVYRRLGIPLPKSYTLTNSFTQIPEYIPWTPNVLPSDYPDNTIYIDKPSNHK